MSENLPEKLKGQLEKGESFLKLEESNLALWVLTIQLSKYYKKNLLTKIMDLS